MSPASILPYLLGSWITVIYYNESHLGFTFIVGEVMFIESYIFFLTAALYPRVGHPENFSLVKMVAYASLPVYLMWRVQEEMLEHTRPVQAMINTGISLG